MRMLLLLGLLFFRLPCAASEYPHIMVSVSVSAPDEVKDRLESLIRAELRRRSDVEVVSDKEAVYMLRVVCVHAPAAGMIGCSSLAFKPTYFPSVQSLCSTLKSEDVASLLLGGKPGTVGVVVSHLEVTRGGDQFNELVSDIVATFDTDVLEPHRQVQREWRKALENMPAAKVPTTGGGAE